MVKNILNYNNDNRFTHYILYKEEGILLEQVEKEKKVYLIRCHFKNLIRFIYGFHIVLKNRHINIVHTHQPIDVFFAVFARIGLNIKIVRSYHGYPGFKNKQSMFFFKQRVINHLINRNVCMNFFVSDSIMQYFRTINKKQPRNKQIILYNGFDPALMRKDNICSNIRKELALDNTSIVMGMIGSFNTEGRDHFTICKALKTVLMFYPESHFIFIGRIKSNPGGMYERCYSYCKTNMLLDNIHFLGERTDIIEILNSLDLYIHSSNFETFGLSLIEAMVCSIPCIASDISSFKEVTDDGKNVRLFEKGNSTDLVNKIILELDNLNSLEIKTRVARARSFVQKKFSIESHLDKLHDYYLECLK